MQPSVPGGWRGANRRVCGECQSCKRETGTNQKKRSHYCGRAWLEIRIETQSKKGHQQSANDEGGGHDESICAEGESAGPVEGGIMDRIPTEATQKIIFNDGERCDDSRKKDWTYQKDSFHAGMITAPRMRGCCCFACSGLGCCLEIALSAAATVAEISLRSFLARPCNVHCDGSAHEILAV